MLHLVLTTCPTIGVLDVVGHHVLFSSYAQGLNRGAMGPSATKKILKRAGAQLH
jgi:hypothetical protein